MHQKHPKLVRPALGNYARTEFALVGSTCARMEAIMQDWAIRLQGYRTLLVTGEHAESEVPVSVRYDRKHFTSFPDEGWNDFDDRLLGGQYDLALVNGNHYPAARQIVFVDEAKAGTLVRRKDQLCNVFAVVSVDADRETPEWLAEHLSAHGQQAISKGIEEVDDLLPLIERELRNTIPPLRALILAGGKSSRMGTDKSQLVYRNGQTEVERLRDLCNQAGLPVNLSVGALRGAEGDGEIADRFLGLGPVGAICSAFLTDPDAAWLVLACDLPLLDQATLKKLIAHRRADKVATAVRGPGNEWPEPLVAIYEPRAYQRLLQFLSLGYACPRKLLINSDAEIVELTDDAVIANANTREERERILAVLSHRTTKHK